MRSLLSLLLILSLALPATAQYTMLSGIVRDVQTGEELSYCTVQVSDSGNRNVAFGYTDDSGKFELKDIARGSYQLKISLVGYESHSEQIALTEEVHRLTDIELSPGSNHLEAVSVIAQRNLITQRPGMLIYRVADDPSARGSSAIDVLRKAPAVSVDAGGNLSMRGNTNLKILVDGKYSGQIARSPADALGMMPAANIESIEIITSPSAKYDAEGAAGVINIITRSDRKNLSGSLEMVAGNWEQMINPRINAASGKWTMQMNGHLHRFRSQNSTELSRNSVGSPALEQNIEKHNVAPHGSGDLNISFRPDSVNTFNFGVNTWFGNWPDNRDILGNQISEDGSILNAYKQEIQTKNPYLGADFNLGYSRRMQKGRELNILAQFAPSRDKAWYQADRMPLDQSQAYREINDRNTRNRELTAQLDYVHPFAGNRTIEGGLKWINRNVSNTYEVRGGDQAQNLPLIADRSDRFDYSQQVSSLYGLFKWGSRDRWYFEAGGRLENTRIDGSFLSGANFKQNYWNLVPSATLSRRWNDMHTVNLNYTRRLTRPYIWDLNPNVDASDPNNLESGNPSLQPEIADQIELAHNFTAGSGFFLQTTIFWKHTGNAITDISRTDAQGINHTYKENLAANSQYGVNFAINWQPLPIWSVNSNISINHLEFEGTGLQIARTGWAGGINLNTSIRLHKDFNLQAFGSWDSRTVTVQGYESRDFYYSFSARKNFPRSNLILNLAVNNPFARTFAQTEVVEGINFLQTQRTQYYNRAVKLTLTWEWGKAFSEKKAIRKIENDDLRERANG